MEVSWKCSSLRFRESISTGWHNLDIMGGHPGRFAGTRNLLWLSCLSKACPRITCDSEYYFIPLYVFC